MKHRMSPKCRLSMILSSFILLALGLLAGADQTVYAPGSGALGSGWENWSWSSTIDFASTSGPGGVEAISITSGSYAALSLFDETAFANNYAGLRFDISGAQPDVSLYIQSTASNGQTANFPLSAMSNIVNTTAFTTVTVNFGNLPGNGGVLPADTCWFHITYPSGYSHRYLQGIASTSKQAGMARHTTLPISSC
jgi:hypothetical protein